MIEYYNEDCMVGMARYPDKYFELAIVDPPYRDDNQPTKTMRLLGGKMKNFGQKPNVEYFKELFRVSRNQIVWGSNNFIEFLYNTPNMIFWYKHNAMKNYSDGEFAWTSFNKPCLCFDFQYFGNIEGTTSVAFKFHPTQKPVALYKWLLTNYAKQGDKILDTHVGSASSLIACYDMGFDAVGFELDSSYFEESKKRLEFFMRQPKLIEMKTLEYNQISLEQGEIK